MSNSNERHRHVAGVLPEHWDRRPFALASEIREFLATVKDAGTEIDSGGMDGTGDLWVTVQGVEYFVSVRRSNKQLVADGVLLPPSDIAS